MARPKTCFYCHGTGLIDGDREAGEPAECGFCYGGKPLDTQDDWDRTWGRIFDRGDD